MNKDTNEERFVKAKMIQNYLKLKTSLKRLVCSKFGHKFKYEEIVALNAIRNEGYGKRQFIVVNIDCIRCKKSIPATPAGGVILNSNRE